LARRRAQAISTRSPVAVEPVKLIAFTRASFSIASPTTLPCPIARLNTPGGNPARLMISANAQAQPGTRSAGLKTTVLPYASAGAIFHAGIAIGKFHGAMMPTTPIGSRVMSTSTPGRTEASLSPRSRSASWAKNLKMAPARAASPIASGRVLPSSRASRVPSSVLRAMSSLPIASSASARCCTPDRAQPGAAACAASIASAASAVPALA
jgi:hypothetical protein